MCAESVSIIAKNTCELSIDVQGEYQIQLSSIQGSGSGSLYELCLEPECLRLGFGSGSGSGSCSGSGVSE